MKNTSLIHMYMINKQLRIMLLSELPHHDKRKGIGNMEYIW